LSFTRKPSVVLAIVKEKQVFHMHMGPEILTDTKTR